MMTNIGIGIGILIFLALGFEIYRYIRSHPQAMTNLEDRLTAVESAASKAVAELHFHAPTTVVASNPPVVTTVSPDTTTVTQVPTAPVVPVTPAPPTQVAAAQPPVPPAPAPSAPPAYDPNTGTQLDAPGFIGGGAYYDATPAMGLSRTYTFTAEDGAIYQLWVESHPSNTLVVGIVNGQQGPNPAGTQGIGYAIVCDTKGTLPKGDFNVSPGGCSAQVKSLGAACTTAVEFRRVA